MGMAKEIGSGQDNIASGILRSRFGPQLIVRFIFHVKEVQEAMEDGSNENAHGDNHYQSTVQRVDPGE